MKLNKWLVFLILAMVFKTTGVFAVEKLCTPVVSASSLDLERQKLEVERMKLENEKMKFELEKAKMQLTQPPKALSEEKSEKKEASKEEVQIYRAEISKKSGDLAKQNKENENILVVDFINSEIWHHGVPYSFHELYAIAQDQKWPMKKTVEARANNGYPRYLYRIRNISLLRYDGRDRGIVELNLPSKDGDFRIVSPEGVSFDSLIGDVRNAYKGLYFFYDSQYEKGNWKVLRYKHSRDLNFDDILDIFFDKEDKIAKIRYGVLGEN